jgi:tryptophan-rich sensory protein
MAKAVTMDPILFLIFLGATAAAAATGLIFPPGSWYESLVKPAWTPPKWAFPVAWTTLYLLMALAGARLAAVPGAGMALALWSLQIALNTLWTPLFFGARRVGPAAAVLLALWLAVAALVWQAAGVDGWAALMLLPYLVWLTLAASLNLWIWRHNRGAAAVPVAAG